MGSIQIGGENVYLKSNMPFKDAETRRKQRNNRYAVDPSYREQKKQYYLKNKDKIIEKRKDRYLRKKSLYQKYWLSARGRYATYRHSAKVRKINFELDLDDFKNILNLPCGYCGTEFDTVGIDRIDNKIGYVKTNIVSCCRTCNLMKRTMSKNEFINQCEKIYKFYFEKNPQLLLGGGK